MIKILLTVTFLIVGSLSVFAFANTNKPVNKPTPKPTASSTPVKPTPKPTPSGGTTKRDPPAAATQIDYFPMPAIIFFAILSVMTFGMGIGLGILALGDAPADGALRGLEASLLAVLGGIIARVFIGLLLSAGKGSPAAEIAVGWGFFLFPGAVDTVAWLANGKTATTPEIMMWIATFVGAFTGFMNGFWQIHDWKGIGWLAFPLDVTWGLAGATTGSLLHIINFAWAGHGGETRYDAHRYSSGMRFKGTFALTQGPVMSNLPDLPGATLYSHERTHVWQNRIFGPMFTLTYLGWMAVWAIPGIIAAIVTRDAEAIQSWCYYNNPWETWAYIVGAGPRTGRHPLIWGDLVILGLSIPFFAGAITLMVWSAVTAW